MSVNVILQARMSSSRLPGKVMMDVCGAPMLARQIDRIRNARFVDRIIVATSDEMEDTPLALMAQRLGVECYRGPLKDVLGRFCRASDTYPSDHVVRLTGDCPLTDPGLLDDLVALHLEGGYDLTSLGIVRSYPHGLDAEVVTRDALQKAGSAATTDYDREHVTPYIYANPDLFSIGSMSQAAMEGEMRWTVDYPEDLELVRRVFGHFLPIKPNFSWTDVKAYLAGSPDVRALNAGRCTLPQQQQNAVNGVC